MKKPGSILSVVLILVMLFSLSACGSGSKESQKGNSASGAATSDSAVSLALILKGVYDNLLKSEGYAALVRDYPNTHFDCRIEGDRIVVRTSGTDGLESAYKYVLKNGYFVYKATAGDYVGTYIFQTIIESVGEYYGIGGKEYVAYLNGLSAFNTETKYYSVDRKYDGSGTVKIYVAEKPEMKELDTLYINEFAMAQIDGGENDTIRSRIGKLAATVFPDRQKGTLIMAVGEKDGNTELTYKSIVSIVTYFKPNGYEAFLKTFTELKEVSADDAKVFTDSSAFANLKDTDIMEGYKYYFVTIGKADEAKK